MREVKYRGFSISKKQWVYGYLVIDTDTKLTYIVEIAYWDCIDSKDETLYYEVYFESVGQYTGLKDKNGKEIYDKDIIKNNNGDITEVEFLIGRILPFYTYPEYNCWNEFECGVIGNIYENPELLE